MSHSSGYFRQSLTSLKPKNGFKQSKDFKVGDIVSLLLCYNEDGDFILNKTITKVEINSCNQVMITFDGSQYLDEPVWIDATEYYYIGNQPEVYPYYED